jgi:hypothetical protein
MKPLQNEFRRQLNIYIYIVTGCCRCNRIPGTTVPLSLNGEAISVVMVSYSENKPTAMHGGYTTDVFPVTNPSQCRNKPWDMVSSLPSVSAHLKESRAKTVSQRVREPAKSQSQRAGSHPASQPAKRESQRASRRRLRESVGQPAKTVVSSWREKRQREPRVDSE